jgi:heme exporter protein D
VKASRILPPLLAAMTLLLLGANAVPSVQRKHLLREERRRLEVEVKRGEREGARLAAEIEALAGDPFYVERLVVETWNGVPQGATPFRPLPGGDALVRAE